MSRRRKLVLLGAVILVVTVSWIWMPSREEEPAYQGKSLSELLDTIRGRDDDLESPSLIDATEAVRSIGTNAFPVILKWISYKPSKLRLKITPFVRNLPFGDSFESAFADRGTQAERSTTFFAVMKSQASPLIPDLAPLIYDTTAWDRSSRAMYALAIIGTNSWPVFQQALTTTNFAMTRRAVINVIAFAHQHRFADWSTALPSILKCANGTDKTVTMEAIRAVRHMRLSPESCIPLLTDKLHSADPNIRAAAIEALEQFGHLAESALPPIEVALNDTDAYVRNSATNALETIRNQIRTNSVPK